MWLRQSGPSHDVAPRLWLSMFACTLGDRKLAMAAMLQAGQLVLALSSRSQNTQNPYGKCLVRRPPTGDSFSMIAISIMPRSEGLLLAFIARLADRGCSGGTESEE